MREIVLSEKQTEILTQMREEMAGAWSAAIDAGKSRQEAVIAVRTVARKYYERGLPWPVCYKEMCAVVAGGVR